MGNLALLIRRIGKPGIYYQSEADYLVPVRWGFGKTFGKNGLERRENV